MEARNKKIEDQVRAILQVAYSDQDIRHWIIQFSQETDSCFVGRLAISNDGDLIVIKELLDSYFLSHREIKKDFDFIEMNTSSPPVTECDEKDSWIREIKFKTEEALKICTTLLNEELLNREIAIENELKNLYKKNYKVSVFYSKEHQHWIGEIICFQGEAEFILLCTILGIINDIKITDKGQESDDIKVLIMSEEALKIFKQRLIQKSIILPDAILERSRHEFFSKINNANSIQNEVNNPPQPAKQNQTNATGTPPTQVNPYFPALYKKQ